MDDEHMDDEQGSDDERAEGLETATFGAGCFWCTEAVLARLPGVRQVRPGYMGGQAENPSYEEVCSGATGHAEVVHVRFDPDEIRYETLLEWFWRMHDPTTPNRQGNDVGPQYRSVIFHHSPEQRRAALDSKGAADRSGRFEAPIVTEIAPAGPFWPAEDYHHDYFRRNAAQPYCRLVVAPKLEKLGLETSTREP